MGKENDQYIYPDKIIYVLKWGGGREAFHEGKSKSGKPGMRKRMKASAALTNGMRQTNAGSRLVRRNQLCLV